MVLQRGHPVPAKVSVEGIRSLARSDLSLLLQKRPKTELKTLRDTHHRVARAVAAGLPTTEVAAICGMSLNRVSALKSDPSFAELVAHYRGAVTAEYLRSMDGYMEIATANMLKAEVLLGERLDEAQEDGGKPLPVRDLIAISRDAADRFGYGKTQKNLNVNVDFAKQLEDARRRSARPVDTRTVEAVRELEHAVGATPRTGLRRL